MSTGDIRSLREALESLLGPSNAGQFTEKDLRRLWKGGYTTLETLKIASFDGLRDAKLKPAMADQIIHAQGRGDGYSLKATRMMEALRSIRVLPGPGEVLNLGATFLLHPKYDALFVRECYPRLFDALVSKSEPEPVLDVVTGTPGIGKTWFLYYLLARLLNSTAPPPFIVWEHMTMPSKAWCYTHETGKVVIGERTSFLNVLLNPATWYITDGVPPQLNCLARTVLLTSPKRKTYKEMRKEGASILYMPCWELDELLACRSLLYGTVDEALATELYEHYGGVARFVLHRPKKNPDQGLDELLEELREAVAGCNTAQMRQSVDSISTGPEVSHSLLHIVADEKFKMRHLVFASKWVAEEFVKKAVRDELQGLVISLLLSTPGALKGMLYEATTHAVLSKGGRFTAAPISYDRESFWRGVEEELASAPWTQQEFFKDLLPDTTTAVQTYYRMLCCSRQDLPGTTTTKAGTKRGAQTHLAVKALKLARTEPPKLAPPTQQQAQKLARAKRVVPVTGAGADKADKSANDAAAKKAAAGKDKRKQEAKGEEEAKAKEKAKGKGKEGKPAQAADGAAAAKGVATPTTEPEYREALAAMIRGHKGPVQLSVLGSVVKRPSAVGGKLKAYLESHPDLFAVTPAGVTLKGPPAAAAARRTGNH